MSFIAFSLCFGAAFASYGVPAAPPAVVLPVYQPPQVIVRDPGAIFIDNSWDSHENRHDCGRLDVWKACKRDDECSVPKLRVFDRSHGSIHGFMHCEGSSDEILILINDKNEGDTFAYGQAEVGKLVKCRRGRWSAKNLDGEWTKIQKVSCQVTPVEVIPPPVNENGIMNQPRVQPNIPGIINLPLLQSNTTAEDSTTEALNNTEATTEKSA